MFSEALLSTTAILILLFAGTTRLRFDMSYYIVNIETNYVHSHSGSFWLKKSYPTERGAKNVCTRMNKSFVNIAVDGQVAAPKWKVISIAEYTALPVKMVERVNLMSGEKYIEAEDTPNFCSPASEAYWST